MAKKCIGVRDDTGGRCQRPASSGSDFCFMHKPQEGDARIAYLEHDVYHCPDDGQQLLFVPNEGSYRCDMCGGVLLSAKDIDSEVLESIMELPEVIEEGLSTECPTCSTDSDLSDGETALTNFAVEWYYYHTQTTPIGTMKVYQCGVSNVGHCTVCASTWFAGPGEFDALGRALGKNLLVSGENNSGDWGKRRSCGILAGANAGRLRRRIHLVYRSNLFCGKQGWQESKQRLRGSGRRLLADRITFASMLLTTGKCVITGSQRKARMTKTTATSTNRSD
tara:strand:+ start:268 stop:1104 length:837 start_codon:yes stop_codon:yes gene_type:complete